MVLRRVGARAAWLLASLLLASLLIFAATNALPGDIAQVMLGTNAAPGEVEALRERLGLNEPFLVRYVEWLAGALQFDFGTSYISGRSVTSLISSRLEVSLWLAGLGMVVAILVALPVGAYSAMRRRHLDGTVVSVLSQVGLAIPAFWAGGNTWRVEWQEVTSGRDGRLISNKQWQANITVEIHTPNTERLILSNPMGVYVTGINWSERL